MSSGEEKTKHFLIALQLAIVIIGGLISVIFYSMKEDQKEIKENILQIRLDMQQLKDERDHHGAAINDLKRTTDYLNKVKQDKRKPPDE